MLPLFHDFEDERVLVFGGGPIGARRARWFGREADVCVVAPDFVDDDFGGARLKSGAPRVDQVSDVVDEFDPVLVVAATDDDRVNRAIERVARDRGVLVNRVDTSGPNGVGSVVVPATARDGDVVAAIGTGGRAPVLSAKIRADVETIIDGTDDLAALLGDLRHELPANLSARQRRTMLDAVIDSTAVRTALDDENHDRARSLALDRFADFE